MTAEKWLRNTQKNVFLAPSLIRWSCYQEWKGLLKPLARHDMAAAWHQLAWARDGLSNVCFNSSGVAVMCYSTLKETTRNISTFVVWNGTQRWKSCLNMAHYQTLVSLLVVVIMYPPMDECRTPADDHSEGRRHSSLRGINISCLRPCLWDTRHQQKRKVCMQ